MIISIAGMPGSGKSTVKNLLAQELGMRAYSIGDLRGKMAVEHGMTIDEWNARGLTDASTDKEADDYQVKLGQTEDNFVIDGLLSWHFLPQSIKVFLDVNPRVAVKRIFSSRKSGATRGDEPEYASVEDATRSVAERIASNAARYKKWYDIDPLDTSHYDLILDTSDINPQEVTQKIIAFLHGSAKS